MFKQPQPLGTGVGRGSSGIQSALHSNEPRKALSQQVWSSGMQVLNLQVISLHIPPHLASIVQDPFIQQTFVKLLPPTTHSANLWEENGEPQGAHSLLSGGL